MQTPGAFRQLAPLAGLLVAWTVLSCQSPHRENTDSDAWATRQVEELIDKTVPPGASAVTRAAPHHNGPSVICDWEFETDWDQVRYTRWVTVRRSRTAGRWRDSFNRHLKF